MALVRWQGLRPHLVTWLRRRVILHKLVNLARHASHRRALVVQGKHLLKQCLGIRLGVLEQHPPCPLRVPTGDADSQPATDLPTISVVTPSYNQGAFLERTIVSVLNQHYPRLEYVVQDGGSTDESPAILRRFQAQLAGCESRRDRGQADALNLGFQRTSGEIMAYLNSDDLYLPGTLHYVARYFQRHPRVDVVYGHRVLIDEQDREVGRWVLPGHDDQMVRWVDYVPQETLFWRRRLWDRVGGRFDDSLDFAMDWDLLLRFVEAGARFQRLPRFLAAFRVHAEQKTQAWLDGVGAAEIAALRRRTHGRDIPDHEASWQVFPYLVRHSLLDKFYRAGILRY